MHGGSIDRLKLKAGEKVTAAHINALDRNIAKNARLPGVRVRRKEFPWGTHVSYFGRGGGGSAPVFQPSVRVTKDGAEVRWTGPRALIGGVVPTIGEAPADHEIFTEDPDTGQRPALIVQPEDFDTATGECRIYFRLTTDPVSFYPKVVTPVARPSTPAVEPYTAYKLALFLRIRNGKITYKEDADRQLFSSQGFLAIQRRPSGRFEALFWAMF